LESSRGGKGGVKRPENRFFQKKKVQDKVNRFKKKGGGEAPHQALKLNGPLPSKIRTEEKARRNIATGKVSRKA